jgi:acyl-CoA synthetase (AMP-forming)/AMP-acid ligase II
MLRLARRGSRKFGRITPHRSDLGLVNLTYGELCAESIRFAAAPFSLGVVSGDRVATLMGKSRVFLVTVMAIWRLGAVHVPLFTAFPPPAVTFRVKESRCKVIVCDAAQRPKLEPSASFPTDTPWKIVTTGPADAASERYHPKRPVGLDPVNSSPAHHDVYWNTADPGWALWTVLCGDCAVCDWAPVHTVRRRVFPGKYVRRDRAVRGDQFHRSPHRVPRHARIRHSGAGTVGASMRLERR